MVVSNPKWLKNTYEYKNEVVKMLEEWIVDWIKKWYFLEKRELVESDWLAWIENTLQNLKTESFDPEVTKQINNNLVQIKNERVSKFNSISREEFLDLAYKYLVFDKSYNSSSLSYRDLDAEQNNKISSIFDKQTTWKDRFWENYYRPDLAMTRWEWAFLLSKVLEKNMKSFLTLR